MATRKLEVQIVGEDRGASRMFGSVSDAADNTESRMSRWSSRIAGAIGAAFAVDTIIDWGSTFINAAEESQKVGAQTEAVITSMGNASKVTAEEVADLAEQISLKTGLDDEMIQSGENVLLTFGNIRNEVGEGNDVFTRATEVATDMSVALGQDLQSSVVQIGKALNDPIAGLTALSRVGVQFTDDQKNMITWLTASGDALGAQKIILAELERQFGGSAEAQATASDKLRTAWGNVEEEIGTALLPAFEKVATWLSEHLPGAIETTITWIEEHETQVKALAIAVGVVAVAALAAYTVQMGLAAIATLAATWPILLIIALVAVLVAGLIYAYTHWDTFRHAVDNAVAAIRFGIGALQTLYGWLYNATVQANKLAEAFDHLTPGSATHAIPDANKTGKTIPKFADGGVVPGPIGQARLAVVHGGETVLPTHQPGFGTGDVVNVNVHVDGSVLTSGRDLIDVINDALAGGYRLQAQGRGL